MTGAPDPASAHRAAWLPRIWGVAVVYSLALLWANYQTGFHVGLNDFWGNHYEAEVLDFSNPETLYDGFFPIGYPLLLRAFPSDDMIAAGFLIAAAARVVFLGLFGSIMLALVSGPWALVSMIALALIPRMFQHVLTPTADIPMLVFLTPGIALLVAAVLADVPTRRRVAGIVVAGALLGFAGMLRQHALAAALGVMIGGVLVRPRAVGWVFAAGLACTLAYAPQMIVTILAGHGPLDTAQYINIYKMTHGVELRDIPPDLAPNVAAIVQEDPQQFARAWAGHFFGMLPLLVPAVLAAVWPRDVQLRRIGHIALVAGTVYLAAVAMGWSHRAILPVLPWTVALSAALLYRVYRLVSRRDENAGRRLIAVGTVALVALGVLASNRNGGLVSYYLERHHWYSIVEQTVARDGVVHAKQLYSTDGDLYLPLTPPHLPYFDGSWLMFTAYEYSARYPALDKTDIATFHRDCVREGVTHLVLSPNAANISETLGQLRANPQDATQFVHLGTIANYELFRRN